MSQFTEIDPILSQWAVRHALRWYSEYQDTEVRTLYLNPDKRNRVQIAVDVLDNGRTTVRLGQNRKGLSRLSRIETYEVAISELADTLDNALQIATNWSVDRE